MVTDGDSNFDTATTTTLALLLPLTFCTGSHGLDGDDCGRGQHDVTCGGDEHDNHADDDSICCCDRDNDTCDPSTRDETSDVTP